VSLEFKNVRLIEDCMIFDEATGKFHRVSKTAAFIIGHLKVQTSVPDIIEAYAFKFSIPITTAARDVELFLNDIFEEKKNEAA
jgi:hypothetical protein